MAGNPGFSFDLNSICLYSLLSHIIDRRSDEFTCCNTAHTSQCDLTGDRSVLGAVLGVKHMLGMGLISIGVLSIDGRAANILMSKVQIQRACHKRFPNRSRPDSQMLSLKRLILRLKRLLRKSLIS